MNGGGVRTAKNRSPRNAWRYSQTPIAAPLAKQRHLVETASKQNSARDAATVWFWSPETRGSRDFKTAAPHADTVNNQPYLKMRP